MRPRPTLRPLLWCLLLLSLPSFGQRPSRSGIGLKAAGQWCTQRAEGISFQPVPGAHVGLYFPLWCGNRFELQPELLLSAQGMSRTYAEGSVVTTRMLYAHLPVNAKLYVSNALNGQFGAYGGRLLSARANGEDVAAKYNAWDFGFSVGIGLDLMNGFDISARYLFGYTPVLSGTPREFPKNRVAQLSFGYRVARLSHRKLRKG
jgi:Outer membrane protein beta-barrel domain